MPKSLHTPLIRMSVAFGILLFLGLWQIGFVASAVMSNVVLNLTILGTFAFGVWLAYRNIFRMINEETAFSALREAHADLKNQLGGNITDPMWRHYRCSELAVVFKKPDVLGQAYQLISEEMSKGKEVYLSPATMQTLVESIQSRLDDRKSLTQYVSGILVLLGLIGTFIGLMLTLSSVGRILAEIDLSGDDPTGAISALMANLQIPLQGMATGFSSSLFGLICSLTLSLMIRFSAMAFSDFTNEFEGWLANIVEIDSENRETGGPHANTSSSAQEERQLALMLRAARITVSSNTRLNDKVLGLIDAVNNLTNNNLKQTHAIENLLNGTNELTQSSRVLAHASRQTLSGVHAAMANSSAKDEIVEATTTLALQLETRDSHLVGSIQALDSQLHEMKRRAEVVAAQPATDQQDAYDLLKEIKSNLSHGDMMGINDKLWADGEAVGAVPVQPGPQEHPDTQTMPADGTNRS